MQERCKWQQPKRNLMLGDIVILRDENTPRNVWPLGLVVQIEPDAQGRYPNILMCFETVVTIYIL